MLEAQFQDAERERAQKILSMLLTFVASALFLAAAAMAVFSVFAATTGYRISLTDSIDTYFPRITPLDEARVGDYVEFCAPIAWPSILRGSCAHDQLPLIKIVAAAAGDVVRVSDEGVYVNGALLKNSRPLDSDPRAIIGGRHLPRLRGEFHLKAGELWAAGSVEKSFDSRYFGPISAVNAQ